MAVRGSEDEDEQRDDGAEGDRCPEAGIGKFLVEIELPGNRITEACIGKHTADLDEKAGEREGSEIGRPKDAGKDDEDDEGCDGAPRNADHRPEDGERGLLLQVGMRNCIICHSDSNRMWHCRP